jgi:hypothetical protein
MAIGSKQKTIALRFNTMQAFLTLGTILVLAPQVAQAQTAPDGYDWVTVGAPGNAPWSGFSDPISPTVGRGSVNYEYRMGRTEVTTAQWVEFFNAARGRADSLSFEGKRWFVAPVFWGATRDTSYTGPGIKYKVRTDIPDAGMIPVSGISWRTAAVLCNWLHNDKSTSSTAFLNGAYDVSTFTPEFGGVPRFDDQRTHSPGAKYWIPTLDESMKAGYYDPEKNGGAGGWWTYPNRSDTPLVYGPPPSFGGNGTGQANAGFELPGRAELRIPLGAYPSVTSPWGLLDVAGGTTEWLEEFRVSDDNQYFRLVDGSFRGSSLGNDLDAITSWGSDWPWAGATNMGVRLASVVPTPGMSFSLIACSCVLLGRPSRTNKKRGS